MHICYLCDEYPPAPHGGVGSFTQTLATAMVRRGHRVTVVGVCVGKHRVENDQGVTVFRIANSPIPGSGFFVNSRRLQRVLAEVHASTPIDVLEGPELTLALVSRRFPASKLIRMHGGHHFFSVMLGREPRTWRSWLEMRAFRSANHLCAVSHFVAETTRKLLVLGPRPIEVLPNPIDLTLFQPSAGDVEQSNLILFTGTVCEKKGVRELVAAMPRIVEAVPDARVWFVGRDGRDAAGRSFSTALIAGLPPSLRERIVFKGSVPRHELRAYIAQASVCVFPSHMEALPLAWLEAMAMGKATVASCLGPGPEVIDDDISGLLCNPLDPPSIAGSVIRVLRDPGLRTRLGRQARTRVMRTFALEPLVERNEAFYMRCSASPWQVLD